MSPYVEEVQAALEHDSSRLGHVWRHRDKTPKQIAETLDVATAGFVYNQRAVIAAIVDNQIPQSPSVARQVRVGIRGFIRRDEQGRLSESTVRALEERAAACARAANDPNKIQREQRAQDRQTTEAEGKNIPGIYVYTYPHYLHKPVLPGEEYEGTRSSSSPRTYLKIGKSGRDVAERLANQMRGTAIPEEPVLLRIYRCDERSLGDVEKRLHEHLRAADHGRTRRKGTGKEWFLTHLELVDSAARLMGLEIAYDHEAPTAS